MMHKQDYNLKKNDVSNILKFHTYPRFVTWSCFCEKCSGNYTCNIHPECTEQSLVTLNMIMILNYHQKQ